MEARLIKDIQPKYNHDLKDDKTLPVPADHHRRGLSPRQLHPRAARPRRQALRPVPPRQEPARGDPGPPADLQVPHLLARHRGRRPALAVVPAVPAALDRPVHGALQPADRSRDLPDATSAGSASSSTARRTSCSRRWRRRCARPARSSSSRRPRGSATRSRRCKTLNLRGDLAKHAQPEVFYVDPRKGLKGLKKVLKPRLDCRARSTASTSPTWAAPRRSARWSRSSTACRSSRAIAATRSRAWQGVDDFASIREVVSRGGSRASRNATSRSPTSS